MLNCHISEIFRVVSNWIITLVIAPQTAIIQICCLPIRNLDRRYHQGLPQCRAGVIKTIRPNDAPLPVESPALDSLVLASLVLGQDRRGCSRSLFEQKLAANRYTLRPRIAGKRVTYRRSARWSIIIIATTLRIKRVVRADIGKSPAI